MESTFVHRTVLCEEAVTLLAVHPGGLYVDGTLGGGGHARAILDASNPTGRLIGFDRDQTALQYAAQWAQAYPNRVTLVHDNFSNLDDHLTQLGIERVAGILCDLGVSSVQLDRRERGFSYQSDAPLDMRMDQTRGETAEEWIATRSLQELMHIFFTYGEERFSRRIAERIVTTRQQTPIRTTGQLAEIIKEAIPASTRRTGPHPAKRVFQALRIAINDELGSLERLIPMALARLSEGGRLALISFHSLEDRIIKQQFLEAAKGCVCPPQFPQCVCGRVAQFRVITKKGIVPSEREQEENPRSRSARLRIIERIESAP
ncbi:16S rRNA (cytosine(1402)-N(4))-methyltransferase RsmH [Ferroacidibacillus organovorans]|uniref:Ribosomal RNA small subunit methyltransferase H n=1 Tax=Ferroacidibacillus organovorans TaxID=1765683 RepID=A0A162ULN9_9BACL|nr:16S rRNA (cytosine(1402)-N(4))-methyltransferase RsmH [Ferroacidibacillus organovorans]KYP81856.1 16S rRNA (cytosine(1402)-N(4))-methyltransferase [Ferroacidibacillus organovorans]OAG94197.1 ribosomal RNA small subunit methyltransferase H [Ferroacidibacillus organovorans]OPG16229.1 16S rRNA (cytosine(1402)-N(4))-methyltransferase [Ferroacidibacillus organovorans]